MANDTLNAELNVDFRSNKTWRKRAPGEPPTPQFRWNQRNHDKLQAHAIVRAALKAGSLRREPCAVCGSTIVDAHHADYARPLEVEWLCRRHHQQRHAEARSAAS